MSSQTALARGLWSSRLAFILAATGSAVGLGNIWKFPYITGEYGGGAFVAVYLLCIALTGIPLMMAEVLIGRRGQASPGLCFRKLAVQSGVSKHWQIAGFSGIAASFLILCFYSVIGGWSIAYLMHALGAQFSGASVEHIQQLFGDLLGSPLIMIGWHTLFLLLSVLVVSFGVNRGIERTVSVLMPAMFLLLLILVGYAATTEGFSRSLSFLFSPDFSRLSTDAVLTAMGHSFFTLSLGMGIMVAYGSYLPQHISISQAAVTVSLLDTVVALMAGVAIFSVVFANGLEPGAGPGLVFQTLPLAFGKMPGGYLIGVFFFFMLLFAAWSSAISITEPSVAMLINRWGLSRPRATAIVGAGAWLIGALAALSFNQMEHITLFGKTFFDCLDYLTTNIMLPLTGLLIAIFCAWRLRRDSAQSELALPAPLFRLWFLVLRYITPLIVTAVFVYNLL